MEEVDKGVWWSGWVWVGECFFWYRRTPVVPDKQSLNGCVCVCVYYCISHRKIAGEIVAGLLEWCHVKKSTVSWMLSVTVECFWFETARPLKETLSFQSSKLVTDTSFGQYICKSNLLKWTVLGPDYEYTLSHSIHLSMFYTLHCV